MAASEVCDPDWDRAKERKEKIQAMIRGQGRRDDEDFPGTWRFDDPKVLSLHRVKLAKKKVVDK